MQAELVFILTVTRRPYKHPRSWVVACVWWWDDSWIET